VWYGRSLFADNGNDGKRMKRRTKAVDREERPVEIGTRDNSNQFAS
jgi:hypothetical protein